MFAGDAEATPGQVLPRLRHTGGRLATIICFDLDFTDRVAGMARHGAAGSSPCRRIDPPGDATKHYPLLVFRAIEGRLSMIKAETKYASAIIDPYGRIVKHGAIGPRR